MGVQNNAELERSINEPQAFKDSVTFAGAVKRRVQTLTAASTLTLGQSGTLFVLDTAGGFTTTLPDGEDGVYYEFVVGTAPTTAYIIVTTDSDNIIHGQVSTGEDAAGSVACAAASDTITFVANKAIIGDRIKVEFADSKWFISGVIAVQDGLTTTQAS